MKKIKTNPVLCQSVFHAHQRKKSLQCPAPHPAHCCCRTSCGEGTLPSLCAKVRGASSSPYRLRNYKWGLIHSSHCCVLYVELTARRMLCFPGLCPSEWHGGQAGNRNPLASFAPLCVEMSFLGLCYSSSRASAPPSTDRKQSGVPPHTFKTNKTGGNIALLFLVRPAPRSMAHSIWLMGLCLGAALRRICTAPSPALCGWPGSSLADVF